MVIHFKIEINEPRKWREPLKIYVSASDDILKDACDCCAKKHSHSSERHTNIYKHKREDTERCCAEKLLPVLKTGLIIAAGIPFRGV
jgi:hypothetical protein